ncbi:Putative glutathione S-transferase protein [Moritella viscosa]|uniref:glutathione S-transferase family protein n=1 Tax=Moritella viscosa TaxID=80854 RepID=UPI00091890B5|nr:glutathione S-transferase family protein [Moritella viscosa]SGZ09365.1 Putative glutathione S-transferase protein [Moritella viscosa]
MKVYGDVRAGNSYKVQLMLSLLDIEYHWQHVNIFQGESRTDEFLAKNANGKIPVLEIENSAYLAESNAIINFVATESSYLPSDSYQRALVEQWQFFEQYSHEPYIAATRFIAKHLNLPSSMREEYDQKYAQGLSALKVMETQLTTTPYLVGDSATTADIALFAYTHVAEEGGYDLGEFPHISAWITRIQALNHFVAMTIQSDELGSIEKLYN